MARKTANVATLASNAYLDGIIGESFQAMVVSQHGHGAIKRAGTRVLESFYGIGPQAPAFDASNGLYNDINAFLGEASDAMLRPTQGRECNRQQHQQIAVQAECGSSLPVLTDRGRY